MTDKDFKIGDIVIFDGLDDKDIKKGSVCEIIADKQKPYKPTNPLMTKEIYPNDGYDFVICKDISDNPPHDKSFRPFISVIKTEISYYEKN